MNEFTIENFVDGVNEVLVNLNKDEVIFNRIELLLQQFLRHEITIDIFCFEFSLLMKEVK